MIDVKLRNRTPALIFAVLNGIAALSLTTAIAPAQMDPPPPPPPAAAQPAATSLEGSVTGYNYAPNGNFESVMIKSGDRNIQVNFPPDTGAAISQEAPVGETVKIEATPALGMPDHPVYDLVTITSAKGKAINAGGPEAAQPSQVTGTVKNLNYDRHGEVNGAVLDNGDFIHLSPEGARITNLTVGQQLTAEGKVRPMMNGHQIVEAEKINGTPLPAPPPHHGPGGPGKEGPHDNGGGPEMDRPVPPAR